MTAKYIYRLQVERPTKIDTYSSGTDWKYVLVGDRQNILKVTTATGEVTIYAPGEWLRIQEIRVRKL